MSFKEKLGEVLLVGALLSGCDKPPDAIGITIQNSSTNAVKILTAKKEVICVSGTEPLQVQKGDPLEYSTITQSLKELHPGSNNISMTQEKNSGDITIKHGDRVLAIFRKGNGSRELKEFHGGYIQNYCDPTPTDGIELR